MRLERQLQKYIQEKDLNIDFNGHTATNIFGTEYNVTFACTDDYFDFSSVSYPTKEIIIKDACDFHKEYFAAEEGIEYMAQSLGHEITHTETYALYGSLALLLAGRGLVRAIQKNDPTELIKGSLSGLIVGFTTSELLAECGRCVLHSPTAKNAVELYKTLADLL